MVCSRRSLISLVCNFCGFAWKFYQRSELFCSVHWTKTVILQAGDFHGLIPFWPCLDRGLSYFQCCLEVSSGEKFLLGSNLIDVETVSQAFPLVLSFFLTLSCFLLRFLNFCFFDFPLLFHTSSYSLSTIDKRDEVSGLGYNVSMIFFCKMEKFHLSRKTER